MILIQEGNKLKAMALRGSKKETKKNSGNSDMKAELKKIAADGAKSTKIMMHNGFTALVFALAMTLTCMMAVEIAFMASGFVVGSSMVASGDTYSELIVTFVTVAMVCGFALFFAFKIENALMSGMRNRFWHKDPETGEIIKNGKDKRAAAQDAGDKAKNK